MDWVWPEISKATLHFGATTTIADISTIATWMHLFPRSRGNLSGIDVIIRMEQSLHAVLWQSGSSCWRRGEGPDAWAQRPAPFRPGSVMALRSRWILDELPIEAIYERPDVKRGGADFALRAPAHPLRRRLRSIGPISDLSVDEVAVPPAAHPLSPRPREGSLPQGRYCAMLWPFVT